MKRHSAGWLVAGAGALVLAAACGGSTEKGSAGGGGGVVSEGAVAQDQLAQKYADAVCSNSGACCQKYGFAYDATKCSAALGAEIDKEFAEIAAVPGVTYDAAKAGECVAWVKKIVTKCVADDADIAGMRLACGAVWKGTKGEGESCNNDVECAGAETGAVECEQTYVDGGLVGTCSKQVVSQAKHGVKGEGCHSTCRSFGTGSECSGSGGTAGSGPTPGAAECWIEDGLQCDTATYTCVDLVPEGQPCSFDDVCVATAWCKSGTCVPRSNVGGDCDWAMMSSACVDGTYCDEGSKKCAAQVGEGSACTSNEQCTTTECKNGRCVPRNVVADDEICSGASPNDEPAPGSN